MIIKSIYIGNKKEAFFEDKFSEGFNILYSNDNNKGKTIVIQSILYCMGNNPVFPSSFDYEEYYFILTINLNGNLVDICRKKNNFVIRKDFEIYVLDNISEFKNFINKNLIKLPTILKDNRLRIADLELLVQMFFTGQDKKITHDILNSGWLKKDDFINMLSSIYGIDIKGNINNIDEIKKQKSKLTFERDILLKKNKILKKNNIAIETLSYSNKRMALERKLNQVGKIKDRITSLNSDLNNVIKRKTKNELVIKELRSLNRSIKVGQLSCMECGSNHIFYDSAEVEFSFDISTALLRTKIIQSIEEKIDIYNEEIDRLSIDISIQQEKLNEILEDEDISLEDLLFMKINMNGIENDDKRLMEVTRELTKINDELRMLSLNKDMSNCNSKDVLEQIVNAMNSFNGYIDSSNKNEYNAIFTSRNKTYSGSEGTQFHLARMYAFAKIIEHEFPIIVDSFRAEDLSTERERRVLQKFFELTNQIIFTTTLKEEEGLKYNEIEGINCINYSGNQNYKILQQKYVNDFLVKLHLMSIQIK